MKENPAASVKLIILDVDGVLTDGGIYVGPDGELFKPFNVKDGLGTTLAHRAGLKTAIITGRASQQLAHRAKTLAVTRVYQGRPDKREAYRELKQDFGLTDEEICYVGDDLIDLPVMLACGFPCAVADAVPEVKRAAKLVTAHAGGHGAVREVVETILKAQGKWEPLIASFYDTEACHGAPLTVPGQSAQ